MAGSTTVVDLLVKAKDLASAPIRGIVASIKFLDSEISVVAGKIRGAFSGLFGGGLDGAIEFEAQLSKVAAKGGFTADEMAKLKQGAIDIGAQFGVAGTEAAAGMEALAAAGLNATQVMQTLPPVLALAKAEGVGMDVAAEKLSDSLSAVGLGFDQAARMADVLAKGANISTTSALRLAEALATAGGIAKTAGLNLEQTVGALSALANAGIKGEKAGTALQEILTQLINPASQASRELSALGITSRDLGTVIGQLAAKGEASNAAILAFGQTAGPGLRALISQGQQSLDDLTNKLADSKGAAKDAADGINNNLNGALAALESAWANVKTALFDPVLEPLTKQAREAATALNDNLANGALKPVQEAIRAFADSAIQSARDFIAGFDFKAALQSLQDFASGAKDAFVGVRDAGTTAASVVQIAWNGLTAGFKTIGASLLAVAASAVSNIAEIEAAASKIGLGSLERANELRVTANELAAKAGELTQSIAKDGEDIRGAFDRLTSSTDGASAGVQKFADAQQGIKDSSPAAEIQEIVRSLRDYKGMADRANAAAQKARTEYEAGKISAADYGQELLKASEANAELAAATERQSAAEQTASPQRKQTANELLAIAKAADDNAKSYGDYTSALESSGTAQAAALQAEIALAQAKGDTVTVAAKTAELAEREATTAAQVAAAKQAEATEIGKVVTAQQAYLASIGGGTQLQQKELQVLQLKSIAMQADAAQSEKNAELKELEARRSEALAGSLGTLLRQHQDLATEHARDADTSERYYQTQLNEIDGAIRVAKAKGDEADAEKLLREQSELRIAQAEAEAQARAQAAADAQQAVDLKTLELAADGELSKADQQQIADLQSVADAKKAAAQQSADNAQAMREEADAAEASSTAEVKGLDLFTDAKRRNAQMTRIQAAEEKARAAETKAQGNLVTSILSGWEKRLGTLSDASRQAFDNWQFGAKHATESVNSLDAALKKNEADMRTAFTAYKDYGFVKWSGAVALHALQIERAFLNQKKSADSLVESLNRLGAEGGPSFDGLIRQAETAKTEMTLLDQASLNNLQNEIDAARQRMQALQEETVAAKDRVSELNAEIAREKGDTAAADALDLQLEKQQKLAEVENNLAQARLENNRELIALYESQRSKLQELYDLKSRNLEKEQQQTKTETTSTTTTSSSGGTTSSAAPSKTYQLNLVGAGGQTLTATTNTDPTAFLDALTSAKKRSLT